MGVGAEIGSRGWLQGSLVDPLFLADLAGQVSERPVGEACCGVVITQSCDLLHHCLQQEPYAEVLLGFESSTCSDSSSRGNQTYAKNPRLLCLEVHRESHANPLWVEFRPFWRVMVRRESLAKQSPDKTRYLTSAGLRILIRWLAQRYDRAAFPDAFNQRMDASRKKLKSIHARISPWVSGLYVALNPDQELEAGERYSADLLATVPETQSDHVVSVEEEMQKLESLMVKNGIDARVRVGLETTVPLSVIRTMKRFPLESISLAGSGAHPTAVQ